MRPIRVLIVDDSRATRRIIAGLLREAGFAIAGEAADGAEGIQRWRELTPDVITVDVDMPVMDGLEMIGCLRAESRVPIVLVTAVPVEMNALRERARELGVAGIVSKAISPTGLGLGLFGSELSEAVRYAVQCSGTMKSDGMASDAF